MCFSPQRRPFFQHLNLQKCSEHVMFCTCSLPNVLFATAALNFWFLLWPHDSAPAALTGLLFDWPDTRIIEKHTAFRDFSNIWRGCIFFLLTFALLHLLSADLTTLLCFSTVHIVGSFYLNFLRWYPAYIVCSSSVPYFKSIQKHWSLKLSSTGVLVVERHLASFPLSTSLGTWSYSSLLQAWKAGQHLCPSPEDVHQRVCKSKGSFEGSSFEHHLPASSLKVRLKKVKNDDGVCIFSHFSSFAGDVLKAMKPVQLSTMKLYIWSRLCSCKILVTSGEKETFSTRGNSSHRIVLPFLGRSVHKIYWHSWQQSKHSRLKTDQLFTQISNRTNRFE